MKKSMLFLVAVSALLVSAQSSFVQANPTCTPYSSYCENWEGKWSIVTNHGTDIDNVTFSKPCFDNTSCMSHSASLSIFCCQAVGIRERDNKTILMSEVVMDPTIVGYYELDNSTAVVDQNTPEDGIHISDINLTCDTFIGYIGYDGVDNFGLQSGKKFGSPDNCDIVDNCTLQNVIPGKVSKLLAFAQPIMPFIIIGSGDPAFVRGDKAGFDSEAIKPLIQLRIGKKIIIAIAFVNPFALAAGDVKVNVNECTATITVK
jgi:hypothetical protein